jgi:hypothetical protein
MTTASKACEERHALITAFTLAVSEYNRIQSLQMESIIKGEGSAHESDLAAARKRMEGAKKAILSHEHSHGCQ